MQCLCATTRAEVDRAHRKGGYLVIGVPSIRNRGAVPWSKKVLWWALGLSSIPLHLMYNSSFFKSLVSNKYNYLIVTEDFINGAPFNNSYYDMSRRISGRQRNRLLDARQIQSDLAHYARLDRVTCIESYATSFLTDRRNLVLVTNTKPQISIIGPRMLTPSSSRTIKISILTHSNGFAMSQTPTKSWTCHLTPFI